MKERSSWERSQDPKSVNSHGMGCPVSGDSRCLSPESGGACRWGTTEEIRPWGRHWIEVAMSI